LTEIERSEVLELSSELLDNFTNQDYERFISLSGIDNMSFFYFEGVTSFLNERFFYIEDDLNSIISSDIILSLSENGKNRKALVIDWFALLAAQCTVVCNQASLAEYPINPNESLVSRDTQEALQAAYFTGCFHHCMGWLN
jgi:hypothetical protein